MKPPYIECPRCKKPLIRLNDNTLICLSCGLTASGDGRLPGFSTILSIISASAPPASNPDVEIISIEPIRRPRRRKRIRRWDT